MLYPDRCALGRAVEHLLGRGYPLEKAQDHGATVTVYLRDPDGNGRELYYDRPRAAWFDPHGKPMPKAERFDPRDLLTEPNGDAATVAG